MDWVAFLASLPAIISGLGEHLPGLLIAGAMVYLYFQREREIAAERAKRIADCKECEAEQRAFGERTVEALRVVGERMAVQDRDREISKQLTELLSDRKEREGHANAKTSGKD